MKKTITPKVVSRPILPKSVRPNPQVASSSSTHNDGEELIISTETKTNANTIDTGTIDTGTNVNNTSTNSSMIKQIAQDTEKLCGWMVGLINSSSTCVTLFENAIQEIAKLSGKVDRLMNASSSQGADRDCSFSSQEVPLIDTLQELEKLNEDLHSPAFFQSYGAKFFAICGKNTNEDGRTLVYKLVDSMFTRALFTRVSMTGKSRRGGVEKGNFGSHKKIWQLLLLLVRRANSSFTSKNLHDSLQIIIDNSTKRHQISLQKDFPKKNSVSRKSKRDRETSSTDDSDELADASFDIDDERLEEDESIDPNVQLDSNAGQVDEEPIIINSNGDVMLNIVPIVSPDGQFKVPKTIYKKPQIVKLYQTNMVNQAKAAKWYEEDRHMTSNDEDDEDDDMPRPKKLLLEK